MSEISTERLRELIDHAFTHDVTMQDDLDAALRELAALRSDGMVRVPREPTEAMIQAGYARMRQDSSAEQLLGHTAEVEIYRAMIAAAPIGSEE
jgi:hypothetical protein